MFAVMHSVAGREYRTHPPDAQRDQDRRPGKHCGADAEEEIFNRCSTPVTPDRFGHEVFHRAKTNAGGVRYGPVGDDGMKKPCATPGFLIAAMGPGSQTRRAAGVEMISRLGDAGGNVQRLLEGRSLGACGGRDAPACRLRSSPAAPITILIPNGRDAG